MENDELSLRKEELKRDIQEFNEEKERIKQIIGKIGGTSFSRKDTIINFVFLFIILTFFILELSTKFLPAYISLEISVLLVSIKIVWMIHSQGRYNRFVFWILNTLEFRINDVAKNIRALQVQTKDGKKNI